MHTHCFAELISSFDSRASVSAHWVGFFWTDEMGMHDEFFGARSVSVTFLERRFKATCG
jgi:hypothetical protein